MISPRIALALLFLSACTASTELADTALVVCATNSDCPGEHMCLGVIRQCVKAGDACVTVERGNAIADADGNPCTMRNGAVGICSTGMCVTATCGDRLTTLPEECDDGADNGEAPGACRTDCTLPYCGDDVLDPNEECVPGDVVGSNNRDVCNPQCRYDFCGDGYLGPNEDCDDGNDVNTDACVFCRRASCADGFVRAGVEACDDGNDTEVDGCNACKLASCGNGALDASEVCDDGNADNTDDCLSTCLAPICGDGFIRVGVEACDLGALNGQAGQACTSSCTADVCGDGHRGPRESCDDGERNGTVLSQCSATCTSANCGDGRVGPYEQCDDGANNGSPRSACRADCQRNVCGDGHVGRGEQCDLALTNGQADSTCTSACRNDTCGDGHKGPTETCDSGVRNGAQGEDCTTLCTEDICGNGQRGPTEQCDDGTRNGTNSSLCRPDCTAILCGNGYVNVGEECDLGLARNGTTLGCSSTCCSDADNDGICNTVDACYGTDASGDTDGDGICNDAEICGNTLNDAVDADADRNPDACDPDNTNAARGTYVFADGWVQSRRDDCSPSGSLNDWNGDLVLPAALDRSLQRYALSPIFVSMVYGTHDNADRFNNSSLGCTTCSPATNDERSPFQQVDLATTAPLSYIDFNQRVGLLAPGVYNLSIRIYNGSNRSPWRITASTDLSRSCLTTSAAVEWTVANQQTDAFNDSPALQLTVTADTSGQRTGIGCPINVRMFDSNQSTNKQGIAFDVITVRKTCTQPSDCNDNDAGTNDTCNAGTCDYTCN